MAYSISHSIALDHTKNLDGDLRTMHQNMSHLRRLWKYLTTSIPPYINFRVCTSEDWTLIQLRNQARKVRCLRLIRRSRPYTFLSGATTISSIRIRVYYQVSILAHTEMNKLTYIR
jgi:hypothetical protein